MQIFELHFNPRLKEDRIFDSFCYEPENIYEKRLGNLYMVGELTNVLPQNLKFLENLAATIKREYYAGFQRSVEQSFEESLKRANEFLAAEVKNGNVSWLGNLNFAALSLKDYNFNFSKVGNLKILLSRGENLFDIGKKLEFQEIEPYPLKVFFNIISGKIAQDDKIITLTKEVFSAFSQDEPENLLNEITKATILDETKLKEILKESEKNLENLLGIFLLVQIKPKIQPKYTLTIKKEPERLWTFSKVFPLILKIKNYSLTKISEIKREILKNLVSFGQLKFWPKIKISFPQFPFLFVKNLVAELESIKEKVKIFIRRQNLILILVLIFVLLTGFFIFKGEREEEIRQAQTILEEVESKIREAESFLILKKEKEANILFQEAWQKLSPQTQIGAPLINKAQVLKKSIEENLFSLNKLEKIDRPEILFEFDPREFIPQKMILFGEDIYLFNPYSQNLFQLKKAGQGVVIERNQKFNLAVLFNDSILFFSKPDKLIAFKNGQFGESFSLRSPYADFNFNDFSIFKKNLYFFDKKSGQIIKYRWRENFEWEKPEFWLKKTTLGRAIAVDGSIWVLDKNSISRYYAGNLQEKIEPDIFPYSKDFSKIFASATRGLNSYLFVLEPGQKRIIILNKAGKIIKQFQSEKFDNLLDFAISQDGKIIYLLNGLKIIQVLTNFE